MKECDKLFYNCTKLEYINIKNFDEENIISYYYMFYNIPINPVICLNNPSKSPNIYNLANQISCVIFSCDPNWRSVQNKISISGQCVSSCNPTYEYQGKCYISCPDGTRAYNYKCYSCDSNCKTCSYEENNSISKICTSCNINKYLDNGKCVDNFSNGYFISESDSTLKICRCENLKCKACSQESLSKNLCITCNDNYYPKLNDASNIGTFINCYNGSIDGYFLDLGYYKECYKTCKTCDKIGNDSNHNCIICNSAYQLNISINNYYNCYPKCDNYYYFDNKGNFICLEDKKCQNYYKLIPNKSQCITDCSKDPNYPYEFRNECYEECPKIISEKSDSKPFYCEVKCSKEYPFEMIEPQICVDNCKIIQREMGLCKINYKSKDSEIDKQAEEKAVENVQKEMAYLDTSEIDKRKKIVIEQKGSTITISSTENQKNDNSPNTTKIDLGECEDKIKSAYNIPKNKSLYILQVEIKQPGYDIPKIEYEIYYPLLGDLNIKLNLTVCADSKIEISIPTEITENIDKYNKSSGYYNDICYTATSEHGTDISFQDRIKEFIEKNLTKCEEDCDLKGYDYDLGKAICSCKVNTNSTFKISGIEIDKDRLYDSFSNFKNIRNIANIRVLKCINMIFRIEEYKNNYANLILIGIIFIFLTCLFIFYCKDFPLLKHYIDMIVFFKQNTSLMQTIINKNKKIKFKKKKGNILQERKIHRQSLIERVNPIFFNVKQNPIKRQNKNTTRIVNNNLNHNINNNTGNENTKNTFNRLKRLNSLNIVNQENLEQNIIINNNNYSEEYIYDMYIKINKRTYSEMNSLPYKTALKIDKRNLCGYYESLVRTKHLLFFSFQSLFDFNPKTLKFFLFFFNFATNFIVNAFFFSDNTMHRIYIKKGKFDFIYNIPQILYSIIISGIINALIKTIALSESNFLELRNNPNKNNITSLAEKTLFILKIKFLSLFLLSFSLLVMFWFYLGCFCAVYKNTQIHLISDTIISLGINVTYPLFLYYIQGMVRIHALKEKKECCYSFSKILQIL